MKKLPIIAALIILLPFSVGMGPFLREVYFPKLDTLMYTDGKDTMYFVVNENNDTVDWFMYWGEEKLDRGLLDYLYQNKDSLIDTVI